MRRGCVALFVIGLVILALVSLYVLGVPSYWVVE